MSEYRVNPFINAMMRLLGEWPLTGPPPLSEAQYKQLFSSSPSFVDYFPIVAYDDKTQSYLLDDNINIAKLYRVNTRYMDAKSSTALAEFTVSVTHALNALPVDDDNPYVVQVYLQAQSASDIAEDLAQAVPESLRDDALTQAVLNVNRKHARLLSHPKGVFPDSRLSNQQGWRVNHHSVYLCVYRKADEKFWQRNKKTPAEQTSHDLQSFVAAMQSAGITLQSLSPVDLINWLAPMFGKQRLLTKDDYQAMRQSANFDLGQIIFDKAPIYHQSEQANERGIWRFGDSWSRYLTIGGIDKAPKDGIMTLGTQSIDGSEGVVKASIFEALPTGSMLTYTIVPQSDYAMKQEINQVLYLAQDGASREAKYATEQAEEVQEEMLRNQHKVFYVQMGLFLHNNSLENLLDDSEQAIIKIKETDTVTVINPIFDLISQDSYIRALPTVYDFKHDRKAALRARKCYTAHLAALLPFYGNRSGSANPCYVMFTRSGEPFYMNPFHPADRERVAHEVFFGPTGSGKSATVVYMTLMSMAINNPRFFIFDYGNSFKLLAEYAQAHGKKVKRITLSANSEDVLAPFFETQNALKEAEIAEQISKGQYQGKVDSNDGSDDDEERSYLAEMEFILRIMVTGGNDSEADKLTQSHIARLQEALVRGLKLSVAQGEPHARPIHMATAMRELADEEATRAGGLKEIALNLRDMADAILLWTKGLRGMLFNRTTTGFSADHDLTIIEIGALGKTGSADLLAVAGLSAMYTITALAEKTQADGRAIEVKIDEAHLWAKVPMLMEGLTVAAKVFRKLNTWLCTITQDVSDFAGESGKILSNAEFWWLMRMSDKEIQQVNDILDLDEEVKYLISLPKKEDKRFVEGISLSAKYPDTLVRYLPPSLMLALGQTEGSEKNYRQQLMTKHQCTELEAAYLVAEEIEAKRKQFQQDE